MGKVFSFLIQFFLEKRLIFIALVAGIVVFLFSGLSRLNIDEDLYSIFPKSGPYKEFNSIVQENSLNKQIIFSIDAKEDVGETEDLLFRIEEKLTNNFQKELKDIIVFQDVNDRKLLSYLQKSFVLEANANDYKLLEKKLRKTSIDSALQKSAERLTGSSGMFLKNIVALDPLGITTNRLAAAKPKQGKGAYVVKDGLVYSSDENSVFFFATIKLDSKNTLGLENLDEKLNLLKQNINKKDHPHFDYFGTFQIAVENAKQVKSDTYLTSFLSLGLILLLLIVYYRSILVPIYFIFPAIFGVLSGLGMVGWIQPNISAISLATSSVLLGIVLDYSFHFFTHYKHSGNIFETIEEISTPLIIGSFTTVAALGALLFADSVILQNFGLIALFTLLGSAFFTLLLLPTLLVIFKIKLPKSTNKPTSKKMPKLAVRLGIVAVIGFTAFSLLNNFASVFDADINNLSFHTKELKEKESFYTGIQPDNEKKFYVIASASSAEKAKEINFEIHSKLLEKKKQLHISELISVAPYLPSANLIAKKSKIWAEFWKTRSEKTIENISVKSSELGFSANAFVPFSTWIETKTFDKTEGFELMKELGLNKLAYQSKNKQSYITSIVVDRKYLSECKAQLKQIDGIFILDISEITELMLQSVQKDFNFLLLFSAILVFVTLLLIYGRIELALFAFLPMLLAWIWILGITSLLDIKFNFVNIIIATFIFGLGDDFSIFTTDGLIQKYKTGKETYKSYRAAILLSGITTIIGTGVLIFAKHPAIHSIAAISIVGISTILFLTLFLQPYLFQLLVFNRTEKKKAPITFFTLVYSIFLYTYFFFGSILLTCFVLFVLFPFPAKKIKKRALLNFLISKLAKSTIYAGFHIKKEVILNGLDFSKPRIIVANHSSFLDILLVLMLHPKTVIMVKSWVYNSPVFGLFIRYAGFPFAKEGASVNLDQIRNRLSEGYSVVIFPEGTRSQDGKMNRFHKGAFHIAEELKVDILPILLIGIHEVNSKNDILISRGKMIVKAMDVVPYSETISYSANAKLIKTKMTTEMILAKDIHAKSEYWGPIIMQNFVLKGPILEWYVRVKWMLERRNFEKYDSLIGDRKVIYDFGCGYGYLSYYLHYRNPERRVMALDYDEEKIEIAQNITKKEQNLSFGCGDVRKVEIVNCDAVFLNDVLHYLPKTDQNILLENIIEKLNKNGLLMIRDGVEENKKSHQMTKFTEFLSTKMFGFNKTENPLQFIYEKEMHDFAHRFQLKLTVEKHSNTTSNVLFTFRKNEI